MDPVPSEPWSADAATTSPLGSVHIHLLQNIIRKINLGSSLEGDSTCRVHGDSHLLLQIWTNLLQNSIEAMPRGGERKARITPGTTARVEIRDSASGIDPGAVKRIWRPLFTTKARGTGLGLPLVKKIVEAHGGWIWCKSKPGTGTSFFVEIPK